MLLVIATCYGYLLLLLIVAVDDLCRIVSLLLGLFLYLYRCEVFMTTVVTVDSIIRRCYYRRLGMIELDISLLLLWLLVFLCAFLTDKQQYLALTNC